MNEQATHSLKMWCFSQKSFLETGDETSRFIKKSVFNKGGLVPFHSLRTFLFSEQGAGKCCVNHMFQFSQTDVITASLEIKAEEIPRDWFIRIKPSNRSLSPFLPGSIFTAQGIGQLREPWWTAALSHAVLSRGPRVDVKWGRRAEDSFSLAFLHSEQVREANTNLFHEPCALRQGHEQLGWHSEARC